MFGRALSPNVLLCVSPEGPEPVSNRPWPFAGFPSLYRFCSLRASSNGQALERTAASRNSVKVCCSSVPFGITELLMAAPLPYPALVASHAGNWIAFPGGETRAVGRGEGIARAADTPVILLDRKSPRLNSSHYCASRMPA